MITQSQWRKLGAATIAAAALMAVYAVLTSLLRDTVAWIVSFMSDEAAATLELSHSALFLAAYWTIFMLLLLASLYLALIDLRYIRLQYLVEKREIYGRTMGDQAFREALLQHERDEQS